MCNNTKGGFNCECKQGHEGDGQNCTGDVLFSSFPFLFKTEVMCPPGFKNRCSISFLHLTLFQILTSVKQDLTIVVAMPCAQTPREHSTVLANEVFMVMDTTVQVNRLLHIIEF